MTATMTADLNPATPPSTAPPQVLAPEERVTRLRVRRGNRSTTPHKEEVA